MNLAASNYLVYIKNYFRQRCRMRQKMYIYILSMFQEELPPPPLFQTLGGGFVGSINTKLVLDQRKTNEKPVLVLNWFKTRLRIRLLVY